MNLRRFWRLIASKEEMQEGPLVSPGAVYDFWKGDLDLINPVENHVDREIRALLSGFARSNENTRAQIRRAVRVEQLNDLKWHALRSAVFAIRTTRSEWIESGLAAIAATDSTRIEPLTVVPNIALLYHSGVTAIPTDVDRQFRAAVPMADKIIAHLISDFMRLRPEEKHSRFCDSEAEIQTPSGIGFVVRRGADYHPTYDLKELLLEIRQIVTSDQYEPEVVAIGDSLPERLVRRHSDDPGHTPYFERGTELADALRSNRAGASVLGRLRASHTGNGASQCLSIDLVECCNEVTAGFLSDRVRNNGLRGPTITITSGPLLCVVKVFATNAGIESRESSETLRRFKPTLVRALQNKRVTDRSSDGCLS